MTEMARPFFSRRGSLAEIVNQHGETGHDIGVQAHRLGQRQQGVLARVDFRMMGGRLRDAK